MTAKLVKIISDDKEGLIIIFLLFGTFYKVTLSFGGKVLNNSPKSFLFFFS